jgi:hypothetical protein
MSDADNPGGGDRTVFDPLSADELKALREARQQLRAPGAEAATRPPVGPDVGEDIGDAPTRAMKAIPSIDSGGVTLSTLDTKPPRVMPEPQPMTPQASRPAPTPQQPMSVHHQMTVPSQSGPSAAPSAPEEPKVGGPGFGENTLMWMAPVKPPEAQVIPERGLAAAGGMTPTQVPQDTASRKLTLGLIGVLGVVALVVAGVFFLGGGGKPGIVELVTDPVGATVKIDGKEAGEKTPLKATLPPGTYTVELALAGYRTETFPLEVKSEAPPDRKDVSLYPISDPDKKTVTITVGPVSANISVGTETYPAKRSVRIPNLDPKKAHTVVIEAGGFKKIEQEVKAGQLRDEYNFILERVAD